MILYITPEQQSKHRAQSQASWASSKNRVRPDTNIYPSPSECPPVYLIVPPPLSHVPQNFGRLDYDVRIFSACDLL